jgi:hypothetical protein
MVLEYVLFSQLFPSEEPQVLPSVLDLWSMKVLQWKILRCLAHCNDFVGRSQWVCSSWTSSLEALWVVFRLKPRWVPMLGVRKSDGFPEHKSHKQVYESHKERGDKESQKACTRLKSCESLYTCPHAPFYRKTKRLLHSENALKSREYS